MSVFLQAAYFRFLLLTIMNGPKPLEAPVALYVF